MWTIARTPPDYLPISLLWFAENVPLCLPKRLRDRWWMAGVKVSPNNAASFSPPFAGGNDNKKKLPQALFHLLVGSCPWTRRFFSEPVSVPNSRGQRPRPTCPSDICRPGPSHAPHPRSQRWCRRRNGIKWGKGNGGRLRRSRCSLETPDLLNFFPNTPLLSSKQTKDHKLHTKKQTETKKKYYIIIIPCCRKCPPEDNGHPYAPHNNRTDYWVIFRHHLMGVSCKRCVLEHKTWHLKHWIIH